MKIHHLDCLTMCVRPGKLFGRAGWLEAARFCCHCLLIETASGLVLVDTGLGMDDLADPRRRLSATFRHVFGPRLDPETTAARQVERLGFKREEVRHIIVSHLDVDHAGGLADFPQARVHVLELEHQAAHARATYFERERYSPAQWAHGPLWETYRAPAGEAWNGFEAVRELRGLPPELLMIPLSGHSRGHAGVAVNAGDHWLLYAGDAYFFEGEVHGPRSCPPLLSTFQWVIATDDVMRVRNQDRLRALAEQKAAEVKIFSAHDPVELERFAALPPAPRQAA